MPTTKISVTVDSELLAEIKRLGTENVSLLVNDALRRQMKRLQLIEFLDELEREDPSSPEERERGEKLAKAILSSTPVPSRRSRRAKKKRELPSTM